jgi:hypothetical protein
MCAKNFILKMGKNATETFNIMKVAFKKQQSIVIKKNTGSE